MEEQQIEQTESLEMELTAKGLYKWTIKARDKVLTEDTITRIEKLDNTLRKRFPNNVLPITEMHA